MGRASEDAGLEGERRWYLAFNILVAAEFLMVIFTILDIPPSLLLLIPDVVLLAGGYKAFTRWRGIVGAGERPSRKGSTRYVLGLVLLYVGFWSSSIGTAAWLGTQLRLFDGVVGLSALTVGIILTVEYRRAYGYWAAHLPSYKDYRYAANLPPSVIENFRRINPDLVFETKLFVVVKKGDVYAFLAKNRPAVYFVKPKWLTPAPTARKPNLPFLGFRSPRFRYQINGIPLVKLKGSVTIPVKAVKSVDGTTEEEYAEGQAVVYVLSRRAVPRLRALYGPSSDLSALLDKETIERVIRSLMNQST